jgi:hypothetical protein
VAGCSVVATDGNPQAKAMADATPIIVARILPRARPSPATSCHHRRWRPDRVATDSARIVASCHHLPLFRLLSGGPTDQKVGGSSPPGCAAASPQCSPHMFDGSGRSSPRYCTVNSTTGEVQVELPNVTSTDTASAWTPAGTTYGPNSTLGAEATKWNGVVPTGEKA